MFDVMRYKTNLNAFSLEKLDKNNKFVFNNVVANRLIVDLIFDLNFKIKLNRIKLS